MFFGSCTLKGTVKYALGTPLSRKPICGSVLWRSLKLAELNALEAVYGSRLVPIDGPVAAEWARLIGAKEDKNQRDWALAATARVHGFVLVTRNIDDMRGCDVKVLNPFRPNPIVEKV